MGLSRDSLMTKCHSAAHSDTWRPHKRATWSDISLTVEGAPRGIDFLTDGGKMRYSLEELCDGDRSLSTNGPVSQNQGLQLGEGQCAATFWIIWGGLKPEPVDLLVLNPVNSEEGLI